MRVGLLSDTHDLLDPALPALFRGCALLVHAGDVVRPEILDALAVVAPVAAVRGNNDRDPAFDALPETARLALGALRALVVHDLGPRDRPRPPARPLLARDPPELVIHGHSHRPGAARLGPTLYVNPGSAGPRRFRLPRTAAILTVRGRHAQVAFYELGAGAPRPFGPPVDARL
ncbi:metallophosphoesterase family protein [Anaeromyxobacter sp. PSR-1]|uniref:metallophosphoesterase family protein n=1 Tax=Anaeromyxobacter sp. PSR-1 TaxID=1300915 RepID=UPI0005E31AD1|nr:metallophosphoesterase family protein [Anaeromyxobacter sp. PSR-1]GAO05123.1 putative metallophosphoesterase [Anaeromyxobacter sp. PSR-1]